MILRSDPVAFQYPFSVILLGLPPSPCFLSLGTKKYHSLSPIVDKPAIESQDFINTIIEKKSYNNRNEESNYTSTYEVSPMDHDHKC